MYSNEKVQKFLAIIILILVPVCVYKEYRDYSLRKQKENIFVEVMTQQEYSQKTVKSFVFIVFLAEFFDKEQLESIFTQSYPDFRVVYLYSGEETLAYKKACEWVSAHQLRDKVTFVKRLGFEREHSCFYSILQNCQEEEIVIHLDNGDLLSTQHALDKLNHIYHDPDVWMAFAENEEEVELTTKGPMNKTMRNLKSFKNPWIQSHIKTYYAGLLKQVIPSVDQLKQVYMVREEKALMSSLLELGKWHAKTIPENLTKKAAF